MRLILLLFVFSSFGVNAQTTDIPQKITDRLSREFSGYKQNRYSKNENSAYAEIIHDGKIYALQINSLGEIQNKDLVFTFPESLKLVLKKEAGNYRIEDIRIDDKGLTQIEVIYNNEVKRIYSIDKKGLLSEIH